MYMYIMYIYIYTLYGIQDPGPSIHITVYTELGSPTPHVALYRIICTCTLCTYTYTRYMAYRTLDPRYTLPYIPIRVLHHTKLQTLFTISIIIAT